MSEVTPERRAEIDAVVNALREKWHKYPFLSFGQIIDRVHVQSFGYGDLEKTSDRDFTTAFKSFSG